MENAGERVAARKHGRLERLTARERGRLPTIAMMTDFGIKDGNVGVMKGVIWGICPEAQIADVSHMIGAAERA